MVTSLFLLSVSLNYVVFHQESYDLLDKDNYSITSPVDELVSCY